MTKRRIYWPYGNPHYDAWEITSPAGQLVVRRNHALVKSGSRQCQGWDLWLNGKHLGAVGSRPFSDLGSLSRRSLKSLVRSACCGRYEEFIPGTPLKSRPGWGGPRPNAGRPPKGETKRVKFSTTIDRRTSEFIDQQRGDSSRGEYLDRLVQGRHDR